MVVLASCRQGEDTEVYEDNRFYQENNSNLFLKVTDSISQTVIISDSTIIDPPIPPK